jgi:hypothetical protein
MKVIIRTADLLHKAEVDIEQGYKSSDIIENAFQNWKLPEDTQYSLVNVTKNKTYSSGESLTRVGIDEGDTLEIQPILVAG